MKILVRIVAVILLLAFLVSSWMGLVWVTAYSASSGVNAAHRSDHVSVTRRVTTTTTTSNK